MVSVVVDGIVGSNQYPAIIAGPAGGDRGEKIPAGGGSAISR
jgi:hypothetical protein